MKSKWLIALLPSVLMGVVSMTSPSLADNANLKGLQSVKVEITNEDDSKRGCPVDKAALQKQTEEALSAAGLKPSSSAGILFTVEVSFERRQNNCQYGFDATVHKSLKAMVTELNREITGDFVIWEDDEDDLAALLKTFTAAWKGNQ